ncbi:uncharacterized protein [Periplaneta americana]|uniref:uncharacterized protein n=1 Tax=Periplaneta americana TaxID=6978 RepID=UPI0037E70ECB
MPRLKEPDSLKKIASKRLVNHLGSLAAEWMESMLDSWKLEGDEWRNKNTLEVEIKSSELSTYISKLPDSVLRELFLDLLSEFSDQIEKFLDKIRDTKQENPDCGNIELCPDICKEVMNILLQPSILTLDFCHIPSKYSRQLCFESLMRLENITYLDLDTSSDSINNWEREFSITVCHLVNLEVLVFIKGCTNRVIRSLGLHCPRMKKLNVRNSMLVNNASIRYLQLLRHLSFLDVSNTKITVYAYSNLLKSIPGITNLTWSKNIDNLLRTIDVKITKKLDECDCKIASPNLFAEHCPNLTNLSLVNINCDLSALASLENLKSVTLTDFDYNTCNTTNFFLTSGCKLRQITLRRCRYLQIQDVILNCSKVEDLDISSCQFSQAENFTDITPSILPHFKSVKNLWLAKNMLSLSYLRQIGFYVNLVSITIVGEDDMTDYIVRDAVEIPASRGGLKKLVMFAAIYCEQLTMDTVWNLVAFCDRLEMISSLERWGGVTRDDFVKFKEFAKELNLAVVISW